MIPVFVDGALPQEPTTQALLSACTQVVKPDSCELASRGTAVARILWMSPLRAEIGVERGARQESRTIDFGPADLLEARWQAVGLIVGSLLQDARIATQQAATQQAPLPSTTPTTKSKPQLSSETPQRPPSARSTETPQRPPLARTRDAPTQIKSVQSKAAAPSKTWKELELLAGLGGLAGLGLASSGGGTGPARVGGWAEVEVRAWKGLGLTGVARMAWMTAKVSGLDARFQSVGVGPSLAQPLGSRASLLIRAAVSRDELRLNFAAVEEQSRAYFCWRVGVGAEVRLTEGLTLTGQVEFAGSPRQSIRVAGAEVGTNPLVAPAGLLGMRIRFLGMGVPGS